MSNNGLLLSFINMILNLLNRQYRYIVGKYIIYLYELQKRVEKQASSELFCPVLPHVQANLMFSDNVCMLCLSCKSQKHLPNGLKRAETSVVLIVFDGVLCEICVYTVTVSQHESGTRRTISWSVTIYSKNVTSQCTAQIETVHHDKNIFNAIYCIYTLHIFVSMQLHVYSPLTQTLNRLSHQRKKTNM